jgi:hypothetical protein
VLSDRRLIFGTPEQGVLVDVSRGRITAPVTSQNRVLMAHLLVSLDDDSCHTWVVNKSRLGQSPMPSTGWSRTSIIRLRCSQVGRVRGRPQGPVSNSDGANVTAVKGETTIGEAGLAVWMGPHSGPLPPTPPRR